MPEYRPIYRIAEEIEKDWRKPYGQSFISKVSPYARPYLNAMKKLDSVNDMFDYDSGRDIVNRFLCNASGWRGETARRIKLELKEWLK